MKIAEIQKYLKDNNYTAYIVTRNNMFIGQDVLEEENKIKELTGFNGSAGNLIIFTDKCLLLVDGRYDVQAKAQVDNSVIEVVCTRDSIGSWIHHNIKEAQKFLYDPWCHSVSEVDYWRRSLDWHTFVEDKELLLGPRVVPTDAKIFELKEEFTGISSDEKISYLTDYLQKNNLDAYLLCESDSVSWLMNLRSDLIKYSPILRAYALVYSDGKVSLFTNDFSKLIDELSHLKGKNIGINFARTPKKIQTVIKSVDATYRNINNPITDWKAIKNPIEIAGFKNCHIRDGAAICDFANWLNNNYNSADELTCVDVLHKLREKKDNFYSESFATIAGFGENGAIIHYQPTTQTNKKLESGNILLLDSGGQYYDGTTDVTRTFAIGEPSNEMKDSYTHVLKAHIALSSQVFPEGTQGGQLDTVARAMLWNECMDYTHGTGHGVGFCLNVHEGPQSISLRNQVTLQKGMICSIEPGYYKEGNYGIRIENLALVVENSDGWLEFEPLTMVPYERKLINKSLLSEKEIAWIDTYHRKVFDTLKDIVDEETYNWLKLQTNPL